MERVRQAIDGCLSAAASLLLAVTVRGEWMLLFVHFWKQNEAHTDTNTTSSITNDDVADPTSLFTNVHWYMIGSVAVSYSTFFTICGLLQWFYYIRQKNTPENWKCQPTRWLSASDERHEVLLGTAMMGMGGAASGVVACYVINGGYTTLYFSLSERSLLYTLASVVVVFVMQDFLNYHLHRMFHLPQLYRHIHKWHHRYRAPTPFSATAMHPLEFIVYQSALVSPIFIVPIHSGAFICVMFYVYYYGVIDHSGIKMDSIWPWQPDTMFHDDHHRYFHANFGFNLRLWDKLYGTLRRDDREYGEHIFGGKGREKSL